MDGRQQRERLLSELEKAYPRLDTALVHAFASDIDPLTNLSELRTVLDAITATTVYDDDEAFDPSGTGGSAAPNSSEESYDLSSINEKKSSDMTSFEGTLDQLTGDIEHDTAEYGEVMNLMEEMSDGEKVKHLMDMFKNQNQTHVEFVLKKVGCSFKKALDLLLNYEFLERENLVKKGIEGFDADLIPIGHAKKTKRGKNRRYRAQAVEEDDVPVLARVSSPWRSLSSKSIPLPTKRLPQQLEPIVPQYKPIQVDEDEMSTAVRIAPHQAKSGLQYTNSALYNMGNESHRKANAYGRKANGQNLFGAAAGYERSRAQEAYATAVQRASADADDIVDQQSSPTHVDLHGVSVADARRIAPLKVRQWWDGLGEGRIRFRGTNGIGHGFRIVTGRGRHSAGGRAVLGPAVSKVLLQEGWKIEVTTGEIYITGRASRM